MASSICSDDSFRGNEARLNEAVDALSRMAQHLVRQAEALSGGIQSMTRWEGIAHDSFQERVGDLPTKIQQAAERYSRGSSSLAPYPVLLHQARAGQQSLCHSANDAQARISSYQSALAQQRQWESSESDRARRALTDPSQGSPVPAHWSGPDNRYLLHQAEQDYQSLLGDFGRLKGNFESEANEIARNILAASEVYKDEGGISGFLNHRAQDLAALGKWLEEHGITLEAISDLLGNVSAVFGLLALIPGPWSPIFAAIGLIAGLVKLLIDLPRAMNGEMSWGRYLFNAGLTLLPFAAKGIGAVAMKAGASASKAAKTAATVVSNRWWDNVRLLHRAEQFENSLAFTTKLDKLNKLIGAGQRGLTGHHFVLSQNRLFGEAARNSADAVVDLAGTGGAYTTINTVHTGLKLISKGEKIVDGAQHLYDFVSTRVGGAPRGR